MPLLTFPLALILVACFVGGSVVTWLLQERRHRREQKDLEAQMARMLQARYEVYEGLEQSVVKLISRFDAMQHEFQRKLEEARHPRAALEQTIRLRSTNPELWDLEREHHKVQSEQLSEISRMSARISDLMDALQAVEPGKSELEKELERLRARHEVSVANFRETETAATAKIARLEASVRELETLRAEHARATAELASLQRTSSAAMKSHEQQLQALVPQVQRLAQLESRAKELEQLAQKRDEEARAQARRASALDADLAAARKLLEASETRTKGLDAERTQAADEAAKLRAKLETTRTSHETLQKEHERARNELEQSLARTRNQQETLAESLAAAESLRAELAKTKQLALERDRRAAELEQTCARLSSAHEELRVKAADDLIDARNELHMARSDGEALQLKLAEAETRCAALQSHVQAEKSRFEREVAGARAELEGRWAKDQQELAHLRATLASTSSEADQIRARAAELQVQLQGMQGRAQQERSKLETALRALQAENAVYRAKISARKGSVEEAWSLLTELKPMLETLEQKLKVTDDPPAAQPPSGGAVELDLSALDEIPPVVPATPAQKSEARPVQG